MKLPERTTPYDVMLAQSLKTLGDLRKRLGASSTQAPKKVEEIMTAIVIQKKIVKHFRTTIENY